MKRLLLLGILALSMASCDTTFLSTPKNVAVHKEFPPFSFIDEKTEELVGFDIDLINALAEEQGFSVRFREKVSQREINDSIAVCDHDIGISSIIISDELEQRVIFSDSYFASGLVITVRTDNKSVTSINDLEGYKVIALGEAAEAEAQKIEGVELSEQSKSWAVPPGFAFEFLSLSLWRSDAVISDYPSALLWVNQYPDKLKIIDEHITEEYLGIVVCNTEPELLDSLNAGLAALKESGMIDTLVEKWFPTTPEEDLSPQPTPYPIAQLNGLLPENICVSEHYRISGTQDEKNDSYIKDLMYRTGAHLSENRQNCDLTIAADFELTALSASYTGGICYSGARVEGEITISSPGQPTITLPIYTEYPPPSSVLESNCKTTRQEAFFGRAKYEHAILRSLASVWGDQIYLSAIRNNENATLTWAARNILEGMDREAVPILIKGLRSVDPNIRENSLTILRRLPVTDGVIIGDDADLWQEWWDKQQ